MNVTVENLAPCKKLVRVELESKDVDAAFADMLKDFQRQVSLPGFRPGKVPKDVVAKRFDKDISDEVKKKLIGDSYRKALEEQKIEVLGYPDIEEIQFGRGQALQFAATVETAPEFQLPEYKGIVVRRDDSSVTNEDIEGAINVLREQRATFNTVERPAADGDVAVVNYTGTCNGKPFTEIAPAARSLTESRNFWVNLGSKSFIPGFADQLLGAKAGDKRTVSVDFAADFVTPELANQKGVFEVEIVEIKERVSPPLDEAFAKSYGAESLAALREGVTRDLENEKGYNKKRAAREQILQQLFGRVQFELPETMVKHETRNVVYELVNEYTKRGFPKDLVEKQKDQIYSNAEGNAKIRVKRSFILQKIAEKEDIKVSQEEVAHRIEHLAAMYQIPADRFLKDLQKRNGVIEIYDQLAQDKTLDFLQAHAKFEAAEPEATKPA